MISAEVPEFLLAGDFVYRSARPLHIKCAQGVRLGTTDGRTIVDLHAASGSAMLGYRLDVLQAAIRRLAALPSKPQFCETDLRLDVARRLASEVHRRSAESGRIGFDLGGAQGIELAIKLVSSRNPRADVILCFEGAYHGRSLAVAPLSASPRYTVGPSSAPFRVVRLPVPALHADSYGGDAGAATEMCMRQIDRIFGDERFGLAGGADRLHSFIFEPLLNVAGLVEIDPAYLLEIARRVKTMGGFVIADEIFTGGFKVGGFLATETMLGSVDIAVLSKFLTNGLCPLSAVWVNDRSGLYETYCPGSHSSTFMAGELSLAIAQECLDILLAYDEATLAAPQAALTRIFEAVRFASLGADARVIANTGRVRFPDQRVFDAFRSSISTASPGVLTATTGLAPRTLIFHPAFVVTHEDADLAIAAMSKALRDVSS